MDKELKIKIVLWRYYFDKGAGLIYYVKYPIALLALYEVVLLEDIRITLIAAIVWGALSLILGLLYVRHEWNAAEIEVVNRIDPFVREMRESIK